MKYLILSFALLLLAGCSDPPTEGVVKAVAATCKGTQYVYVSFTGTSYSVKCVTEE